MKPQFSFKPTFFSIAVLSAIMGGIIGGVIGAIVSPELRVPLVRFASQALTDETAKGIAIPAPVPDNATALAEEDQTVAVVDRVSSAIVSIIITKDLSKFPQAIFIDPFTGMPLPPFNQQATNLEGKRKIGGGSGFLVSSDGLIVTNRHVVEDVDAEYTVVLKNGEKMSAKILARDPVLDLAVLDIEGDNYPYLTFGDSDSLKPGQTVIAIGNALDEFRNSVTKGIVSGLNRRLTASDVAEPVLLEEAIQTDAAINPGNSGGPLIDLQGRVIGVNTAVSIDGQLIGFALPGNVVKRDVEQVKKSGRITRPFLGIRYLVINEELIKKNQLSINHGVLVSRGREQSDLAVIPGSPADKAGIQENDVILSVNGVAIDDEHSLSSLIGRQLPGDTVKLRIFKRGEEKEVSVTLDEFKP